MDTPSRRLGVKLQLAYPELIAHARQLWHSPFIRELYPAYLGTMHMIVRSAVPLMESALEQASARSATDSIAAALVPYLTRHIREETGHDTWLLEDLAATGADASRYVERIPPPQIAAMVGAQYYWLRHHHPIALLGHLAAIESHHPPLGFASRLRMLSGYPRDAFRAISRHELLDIGHKQELQEIIDSLPLKPEHERMIGISALHTMHGEIEVLAGLYAEVLGDRVA